jgi:hypothetical protein
MNYLQGWIMLKEFLREQNADAEQQLEKAEQDKDELLQSMWKGRVEVLAEIQQKMKDLES